MPTQADSNLWFIARDLDSPTTSFPAHRPTTPSPDEELSAGDSKLDAALHGAELTDDPGPAPVVSVLAAQLHRLQCDCEWPGDVDGHGRDYEEDAQLIREGVLDDASMPAPKVVPVTFPIEAKVKAGAWATLAATMGLALVSLLLAKLDLIPSLLGGLSPWVGALVMVLGVILPPIRSALAAYGADHTPRPDLAARR